MPSDKHKPLNEPAPPGTASSERRPSPQCEATSLPPAGPHARPELMNPDVTPGTGALPPIGTTDDPNAQPTS
jgi:hypothetical protein